MKEYKGIPKNDIGWVEIHTESGEMYCITSKKDREVYYLYKIEDDTAQLMGQSQNPLKLEEKFIRR